MGIQRLAVQKILNHVEAGVTAVYDRYSYDREKREALEAWAVRLHKTVSTLQDVQRQPTGSQEPAGLVATRFHVSPIGIVNLAR